MKVSIIERIGSSVAIAMLIYSRVLSLTPGTDLGVSIHERLYMPQNVRFEELNMTGSPPAYMIYVDHSIIWIILSILGGIVWFLFWTYRDRFSQKRTGSWLEEKSKTQSQ